MMGEKLQYGRAKTPPRRQPDAEGNVFRRAWGWNTRRRAVKKRRLARMSRGKRVARKIGIIGTWFLGLVTFLLVLTVVLFYTLSDVPRPESLPLPQVATIEYADGSTMARIGSVNRTIVTLDKVPEQVRYDVLAAEDRNFYSEPGVSIKGTLRAALSDVTGGDTQGGSGITQQYAKNAYLSDSRTLTRKLKELMIAVKLARDYSKDQILEFYLNTVYFGRGAYGIEAAAQTYFGVDVQKLSVEQGAVLAALLRAPSYYDPAVNPEAAKARWHYVIDGMVTIKRLTQQQADALKYPAVLKPSQDPQLGATGTAYFIYRQVVAELEAHGISEAQINTRGLTIKTTIDPTAEKDAMAAVTQTFANLTPQQRNYKNALVAVNPATGAVLAYYGGPNGPGYNGKADYNDYAGVGSRPAGSSFKPFTLATVLTQTVHKTPGKPPLTISSYVDGSQCVTIESLPICNDPSDAPYSSPSVTIKYAMQYSLNTTFDLLAAQAGPDNVASIAHAMGISRKDAYGNPTLVDSNGHSSFGIGVGDYAVRPVDQAVAFATLANGGVANPAYFVQSATDSGGNVVYQHKATATRALDPNVANDVTLTLETVPGTSGFPLDGGRVAAAKTGTVGIGKTSPQNSDAWTVGYTPQVSAAVWAGSGNSVTPIYNSYGGAEYGKDLPGRTWQLFMNLYLANQPMLAMATQQLITGGVSTASVPSTPTPTPSPTPTRSASTSASSRSTSAPPSTTPASSRSAPKSTPPPSGSAIVSTPAGCGGLFPPPGCP